VRQKRPEGPQGTQPRASSPKAHDALGYGRDSRSVRSVGPRENPPGGPSDRQEFYWGAPTQGVASLALGYIPAALQAAFGAIRPITEAEKCHKGERIRVVLGIGSRAGRGKKATIGAAVARVI
jgi:hypothetical protein